jgi:hypothetical protein
MDQQTLSTAALNIMNEALGKMPAIVPTSPPDVKTVDIVEYDKRMKVSGVEKFDSTSYVSVINFYSNQGDLQKHKPKGAFILLFDSENAGKFYKALGFSVSDDEDDMSMINTNGEVCLSLATSFKTALASLGYGDLVMSEVANYKNKVLEGVEYSPEQKSKLEITFTYFKRKSIVLELSFADIAGKK